MFLLVLAEGRSLIRQRDEIEARAVKLPSDLPDYQLLTTIPGIGPINAMTILAEAGALRNKTLADIGRGFRALKFHAEIAPVHHRLPDRIRAHALFCLLAFVLNRVLRMRLKANPNYDAPRICGASLKPFGLAFCHLHASRQAVSRLRRAVHPR